MKNKKVYRPQQSPYLGIEHDNEANTLTFSQIGKEPLVVPIGGGGTGGGTCDIDIKNDAVLGGYVVCLSSTLDDSRYEINFTDKEMTARLAGGAGTSTVSFTDSTYVNNQISIVNQTINNLANQIKVFVFKPTDGNSKCVFKVPAKAKMI